MKTTYLIIWSSIILMPISIFSQDQLEKIKFKLELPEDFELVSDEELRVVYQNEESVSFAYDIGKDVTSFKDVELIAAMTAITLSETLNKFELLYHENTTIINEREYVMLLYTCEIEMNNYYNALFLTKFEQKLITFSFTCPLIIAEKEVPLLEEIMESIIYQHF
jgi:hypothetical protein